MPYLRKADMEAGMKRFLLPMALLLVLSGCGPWVRAEHKYQSRSLNVGMELPVGWMRANVDSPLAITRDGMALQQIRVERMDLAAEKQFRDTKKRVTRDMLPQEVAEVILDDYQCTPSVVDMNIEENAPALLGSLPGYKILFTVKHKNGLRYRSLEYGALSGGYLYRVEYAAPARHYFDKDLQTFEAAVKTFRFLEL